LFSKLLLESFRVWSSQQGLVLLCHFSGRTDGRFVVQVDSRREGGAMDLLAQYSDGGEDPDAWTVSHEESSGISSPESSPVRLLEPRRSAAPEVSDSMLVVSAPGSVASGNKRKPLDPSQRKVNYNPTAEQLWAPVAGPEHPYAKDGVAQGLRNHKIGFVEDACIAPFMFDEQYNTFYAYGFAADPSATTGNNIVGDLAAVEATDGASVYNLPQHEHRKQRKKKPRLDEGEVDDEEKEKVTNPATDEWLLKNSKSPWAGEKEGLQGELTAEQTAYAEAHAEKKSQKDKGDKQEFDDKSTFHGKDEVDYQGRSWISPPKDHKATNEHCYIPKRWVHTWSGHTKGVSAIRFFPKYGHLLLSGSMDTKVKIWDVHGSGKCMRTYMGHSKAVRDITFNNDGSKFLTASYDRKIKLWDTETGQVLSSFSTGKIPYVVKFNPDDDKQNVLLAGMSDKKIVQWDMNTGEISQEYDQHLGAVNTITFVDDNRRFVTSSDDKSLRVWEFGIPVVIKYISEPHMHSMPSITVHPNTNWFAAQSLDNQILIYSTRERFRLNKKKRFAGHIVAGYACQVNFSPDGRFIMSGDGEGRCWFWDWKTCKVFRTLKCHEGVCIGAEWHPLEQSKVATCGWDGLIKYWD
jgi:pre-mRNA-processing factor 17